MEPASACRCCPIHFTEMREMAQEMAKGFELIWQQLREDAAWHQHHAEDLMAIRGIVNNLAKMQTVLEVIRKESQPRSGSVEL